MKRNKKSITKDNLKKLISKDNSFIKDEISLDDKTNKKYFDSLAYEEYLKKLESKGGGFSDE